MECASFRLFLSQSRRDEICRLKPTGVTRISFFSISLFFLISMLTNASGDNNINVFI